MENDKKILVICEGKFEVDLFDKISDLYPYNLNFSFYKYETNIHIFGNTIKSYSEYGGFEITDIDIIQVLKEIRYQSILELKFTDILLVFDFDPHDPRFNEKLLIQLQDLFFDSTSQGQLYLNYPMVESAIDFDNLPDVNFINKSVNRNSLCRGQYKNRVKSTSCIKTISNLNVASLSLILKHVYEKLESLVIIDDVKYMSLLKKECEMLSQNDLMHVLNTSLVFLFDYNRTTFIEFIQ